MLKVAVYDYVLMFVQMHIPFLLKPALINTVPDKILHSSPSINRHRIVLIQNITLSLVVELVASVI